MIVSVEQSRPVAVGELREMIDEVACAGSASAARRLLLDAVQIATENPLDLGTGAVGIQDVCHVTDDRHMAPDAVDQGVQRLQGREGRPHPFDQWPAGFWSPFFWAAWSTAARTCWRRWTRLYPGGSVMGRPETTPAVVPARTSAAATRASADAVSARAGWVSARSVFVLGLASSPALPSAISGKRRSIVRWTFRSSSTVSFAARANSWSSSFKGSTTLLRKCVWQY